MLAAWGSTKSSEAGGEPRRYSEPDDANPKMTALMSLKI